MLLLKLAAERRALTLASLLLTSTLFSACGGGSSAPTSTAPSPTATAGIASPGTIATVSPVPITAVPVEPTPSLPDPTPITSITPVVSPQVPAVPAVSATPAVAPGPGFFVDAVNGSDSAAGTFAAPWKTLGKLNGIALRSGEGIYLACGGVWRESLAIGINAPINNVADDVIISGYGDCTASKAVISGADDFSSGWTKSGNIWSRPVPRNTPQIKRLFINGVSQRTAQYPNDAGTNNTVALSASTSPVSRSALQLSAADATALNGRDLVGATVYVRSEPFVIETSTVANVVNNTLQFSPSIYYGMEGGDGYVLTNKLWMLDAPGEYFHDTVNSVLYMYPADSTAQANANAAKVEGSVRDTALKFADHKSPRITNILATMSRNEGIGLYAAPGAVLSAVDASHNGTTGIFVRTDPATIGNLAGATISGSVVSDNWIGGIDASLSTKVSISSTVVSDTGTIGNPGPVAVGLQVGPGSVVDRSVVQRSGYTGLAFSDLNGTRVTNNLVSQYCQRLTDCGGISTAGTHGLAGQTSTVEGNLVLTGVPNAIGAVNGATDTVAGIYLDDFAHGVTVNNNTLIGMPIGLYVHNGSSHAITNNKFWLTTSIGLKFAMDRTDADYMTGNVVRANQFVPTVAVSGSYPNLPFGGSSFAISFDNPLTGQSTLTSGSNLFASNQMVPLFGASMLLASTGGQQLTADGWRGINTSEGTVGSPVAYAWYTATLGPELMTDGAFNSGTTYWQGWLQNGGANAQTSAVPSMAGCTGPCLLFKAGTNGDLLISSPFAMNANLPHVISYTAVLGGRGTFDAPYISRNVSPWEWFADSQGYASVSPRSGDAGDVVRYEAMFRPISNAPARLNLQMTTGVPVAFDSVSVRQVTSYSVPATSELVNAVSVPATASAAVSVTCASLGWPSGCQVIDTSGASIALPTTQAVGTSRLFMRTDSTWKR